MRFSNFVKFTGPEARGPGKGVPWYLDGPTVGLREGTIVPRKMSQLALVSD